MGKIIIRYKLDYTIWLSFITHTLYNLKFYRGNYTEIFFNFYIIHEEMGQIHVEMGQMLNIVVLKHTDVYIP